MGARPEGQRSGPKASCLFAAFSQIRCTAQVYPWSILIHCPPDSCSQLTAQLTATKHWPVVLQFVLVVVQCFICECRVPATVLPLDTLFCAAVA